MRMHRVVCDYCLVFTIQMRGLVHDGLWRKKTGWRRRQQSRQARCGNKKNREQRKRFGGQGRGFQRREREQRKEAREEKVVLEVLRLEFKSFQVAAKRGAEFRIEQRDFNGCF